MNKDYWNGRFSNEEKIWGDTPSTTAFYALKLLKEEGVKSLLILGSGYGEILNYLLIIIFWSQVLKFLKWRLRLQKNIIHKQNS